MFLLFCVALCLRSNHSALATKQLILVPPPPPSTFVNDLIHRSRLSVCTIEFKHDVVPKATTFGSLAKKSVSNDGLPANSVCEYECNRCEEQPSSDPLPLPRPRVAAWGHRISLRT